MTLAIEAPAIGQQEIAQFNEDGVICLRGVIPPEWLDRLRVATERALDAGAMDMNRKGATGRFAGGLNLFHSDPDFQAFAFEGPSWQIARTLMQSTTVRLFSDQLFVKEPGTSTPTPWHHDQTYWPVVGEQVCSVWVTMDAVTSETSGLEFVRGSHRWGRRFDPADFGEVSLARMRDGTTEAMPDIDAHRDQYDFLSWDMEPGDCLVHHSLAVHGAGGNRSSSQRRRAISTRWFGDRAYFRPFGPFQPSIVGLEPGEAMTSPMFPIVPTPAGESVTITRWGPPSPPRASASVTARAASRHRPRPYRRG